MRSATVTLTDRVPGPHSHKSVCLVHISDTHCQHSKYRVPAPTHADINVLLHSGDFSNYGEESEIASFAAWFAALPGFHIKMLLLGNHEHGLDELTRDQVERLLFLPVPPAGGSAPQQILRPRSDEDIAGRVGYVLLHDGDTPVSFLVAGIRFAGYPLNHNCGPAFYRPDASYRRRIMSLIPGGTHPTVLITHTPPFNIMDLAWEQEDRSGSRPCAVCGNVHPRFSHWGDPLINETVEGAFATSVQVVCMGHVHDDAGLALMTNPRTQKSCLFSNAAIDLRRKLNVITFTAPSSLPAAAPPAKANDEDSSNKGTLLKPSDQPAAVSAAAPQTLSESYLFLRAHASTSQQQPHQFGEIVAAAARRTMCIDRDFYSPTGDVILWQRQAPPLTNQLFAFELISETSFAAAAGVVPRPALLARVVTRVPKGDGGSFGLGYLAPAQQQQQQQRGSPPMLRIDSTTAAGALWLLVPVRDTLEANSSRGQPSSVAFSMFTQIGQQVFVLRTASQSEENDEQSNKLELQLVPLDAEALAATSAASDEWLWLPAQ